MRPRRGGRFCILVILVVLAGASVARGAPAASTLQRIDRAARAGALDAETALLYRLYRVVDRSRLPDRFRAPPAQERPVRCGSSVVRAARLARPTLSPAARALVDEVLVPTPTFREDYHYSDNFALVVGSDGVSQPIIDFWLTTFEESWAAQVEQTGFARPPCTDQYYFYVYLGNTGPDVPTVETDVYGWTDLDGSDCPYVVVHADYPDEADPVGMAQTTAAHELQHGVQAAYDWYSSDYWMEATATWAEELTYPAVNGYLMYVNDGGWLDYPELGLTYEDGDHEYGNVVWPLYLAEFQGGPEAIVRIWERCVSSAPLEAMDGYLQSRGTSLDDAFVDFTAHLAARDFADGADFDPVYVLETVTSYPDSGSFTSYLPESYGSSYVELLPTGTPSRLVVTFAGDPQQLGTSIRWGVALVSETATTWSYQTLATDATGRATGAVNDFGGAVERVVLAASVLGPAGREPGQGGVPFGYEASLEENQVDPDAGVAGPDGATPQADAGPAPPNYEQRTSCACHATDPASAVPTLLLLLLLLCLVRRASASRSR